jgi:ribonuclease Z
MMDLIFLGTSSATPTPRRNVTSLVVMLEKECLLLDAGEGTQRQIQLSGFRRGRIDRILITHLHGDHFYGLIGLLTSFQLNRREEPLFLGGPPGLARYIDFMKRLSQTDFGFELRIVEWEGLKEPTPVVETDDVVITAGPLRHRLYTLGYRIQEKPRPGRFNAQLADELGVPFGPERGQLQHGRDITLADGRVVRSADVVGEARQGTTFTFCTDTAPCANAVALAREADLLVHEATFMPADAHQARRTQHSTTLDAVRTAREAEARHLALTHFSTRYMGDLRPLIQSAEAEWPGVICARDFTQIHVRAGEKPVVGDSRQLAKEEALATGQPALQSKGE